jgi:hypothetical protein
MGTFVNFRKVKKVERDEREYIENHTKKKGIVTTLTILTDDGETTINIFKEANENGK